MNLEVAVKIITKRLYFYYADHKTTVNFLANCHLVLHVILFNV